ncbi:VCBS repeat-containing protein, partial [Pseudoxanthomonas sp. SGD-10]
MFINTSSTVISFDHNVDIPLGKRIYTTAAGDLDGDGKPELIVSGYQTETAEGVVGESYIEIY